MKNHHHDADYEIINGRKVLKDGRSYRAHMTMMDHRTVGRNTAKLTDAAGNDGLALHRPGYRCLLQNTAGRQAVADALQRARDAYEYGLTTAWRHDARNEGALSDGPKASGNDAMPVDDIETAYRLYAQEISQAWKTPR
jgi:hypothetical protein